MAQFEAVNNDNVISPPGDVVVSSGQSYGVVRAIANSANVNVIGAWVAPAGEGKVGIVKDDLVEVNCEVSVNVGDKLYLSGTNKGKCTNVAPRYAYFLGVVFAKRAENGTQKATISFRGASGSPATSVGGSFILRATLVNTTPYDLQDSDVLLDVGHIDSSVVINLCPTSEINQDRVVIIKDSSGDAATDTITFHRAAGDTIYGLDDDLILNINSAAIWLKITGNDWELI